MAHQFRPRRLPRHLVLHRQWPLGLMSRHAQRANQFGAVGDAVAAGNQAAYRRPSVTQVSTGRLIMCIPPLGRPVPKFTLLLRVPCQLRSVIPIHIRDKFIPVQLIPIRNSLKKTAYRIVADESGKLAHDTILLAALYLRAFDRMRCLA